MYTNILEIPGLPAKPSQYAKTMEDAMLLNFTQTKKFTKNVYLMKTLTTNVNVI